MREFKKYFASDDLDKWERLTVADALEEVTFEDGEQVFVKGDIGKDFYLILEGYKDGAEFACSTKFCFREAVVSEFSNNSGQEKILKKFEFFGEVSLLFKIPRSATVTARGNLKCVKLDNSR